MRPRESIECKKKYYSFISSQINLFIDEGKNCFNKTFGLGHGSSLQEHNVNFFTL